MAGFSKWDWVRKDCNVKLRHIEVDGCIVNIRTGLKDMKGRRVTSVEILPDEQGDGYGSPPWILRGIHNNRVIELKRRRRRRRK